MKYKIVTLLAASLMLNSVSVFADDLDAQPDQDFSSPAPIMKEDAPGDAVEEPVVVEEVPATDGQN